MRQVELKKLSVGLSSRQTKSVEDLLHKFEGESEQLRKKEEEQSQAAVQTMAYMVRHLSPEKALKLTKEWNDLIDTVKPGEDDRRALYGPLANSYSVWQTHFKQAVLEDYAYILRFRWWSEIIFKLLYILGSALVINGERIRWEGSPKKR